MSKERIEELSEIGERIEKLKFELIEMEHMRKLFSGNMDLFLREKKMKAELEELQQTLREQP